MTAVRCVRMPFIWALAERMTSLPAMLSVRPKSGKTWGWVAVSPAISADADYTTDPSASLPYGTTPGKCNQNVARYAVRAATPLQNCCESVQCIHFFYASFAICRILRNHSPRILVPLKTIPGLKSGNSKHNRGSMAEKNRSYSVGWRLVILN